VSDRVPPETGAHSQRSNFSTRGFKISTSQSSFRMMSLHPDERYVSFESRRCQTKEKHRDDTRERRDP
jgi:hypothetical protein